MAMSHEVLSVRDNHSALSKAASGDEERWIEVIAFTTSQYQQQRESLMDEVCLNVDRMVKDLSDWEDPKSTYSRVITLLFDGAEVNTTHRKKDAFIQGS